MATTEKKPLISVVAVSYNHARWLIETLKSIKGQTLQDFELVYADDASSDRSVEVALEWIHRQTFPVKTIIHRENRGLCRTLNEALRSCQGRYLQLVSCDDILLPEKFERQSTILNTADPDVCLVHSPAEIIDAEGRKIDEDHSEFVRDISTPLSTNAFDRLLEWNRVSGPSVLVKVDAIRAAGAFDEQLGYEDWDMWLRLARIGRFAFSSYTSVAYRMLPNALHTKLDIVDNYWILRKHIDHVSARAALMWTAYRLYSNGKMLPGVKDDFLACVRDFPDMRNMRNPMIRMSIPPSVCRALVSAKARVRETYVRAVRTLAHRAR